MARRANADRTAPTSRKTARIAVHLTEGGAGEGGVEEGDLGIGGKAVSEVTNPKFCEN